MGFSKSMEDNIDSLWERRSVKEDYTLVGDLLKWRLFEEKEEEKEKEKQLCSRG